MSLKNRFFTHFKRANPRTRETFETIVRNAEAAEAARWVPLWMLCVMLGMSALTAVTGDAQYALRVAQGGSVVLGLALLAWLWVEARRGL